MRSHPGSGEYPVLDVAAAEGKFQGSIDQIRELFTNRSHETPVTLISCR